MCEQSLYLNYKLFPGNTFKIEGIWFVFKSFYYVNYSRLRLIEHWRERQKIFDSAKCSNKRKHEYALDNRARHFHSFARHFRLADVRLSEVYCNCKYNILKNVGKRKSFRLSIFLFQAADHNSVKQSANDGNFTMTLFQWL